ncbi:Phospholipase D1 [Extremus antarcticus]|uniref:Phospholipase D1 n=1 Tax=Extremus antarcticus TaxID=702011 RepID=A0AAJ0DIE9_9PEZI|nr:Phospholipase D1 [Extremus antarcticus]
MEVEVMDREGSVSPGSQSREVSPHSTPTASTQDGGLVKKSNGYVQSPLRSSQRVNSTITERDLPDVPEHDIGGADYPTSGRTASDGMSPYFANGLSSGEVSPQRAGRRTLGTATPPERKSVQFARGILEEEPSPLAKTTTWGTEDGANDETPMKERQGSFFGKLRAYAASSGSSGHVRYPSSTAGPASPNVALSSQSERSEPSYPPVVSEEADATEEEEESERDLEHENGTAIKSRKRQKSRRPRIDTSESNPSTQKHGRFESRFASFMREQGGSNDGHKSGSGLRRRNTLSAHESVSDRDNNAGLSEDEGKDRIRTAWRRGIEGARGLSYATRKPNENQSPDTRRPGHLRRITGMAGGITSGDGAPPSPFRAKVDRQTTSSAQKWRQVKAGLKMLGQRRRDERMRVDHQKSAQLMAELLAGAPAALVFASMFQRDENDHRKIPVLLEQLKIRIGDSGIRKENSGDRHLVFKIDLEYGNGAARLQWTIWRTLQDFVNLHAKYSAQSAKDKIKHPRSGGEKKRTRMPRFPRSAFPFARNWRGLFDNLVDEESDEEHEHEHEPEVQIPTTPGAAITPGILGMDALEGLPESPITPGAYPFTPGLGPAPMTPGVFGAQTPGVGPSSGMKHKRRKSSIFTPGVLRRSSTAEFGPLPENPEDLDTRQRELYQKRQRRKLETYLQQMIRWLIFRADSTRLCKFLELSALAIRLSAEGGFQGKQGLLTIASRRQRELRHRPLAPKAIIERHKPRWFLIRHSYIVCVDGPESLNPYDVFLVDSDFRTEKEKRKITEQKTPGTMAKVAMEKSGDAIVHVPGRKGQHLIRLYNSERKLKLIARTERQYMQFQESLNLMMDATVWSKKQRFASYAPVRNNVWCRWLVDGRDHMWQVSRAIDNAKDFVYIHDWWLSPELYMRRPAAISQKWRLDRLLQRKAQEGVKIFVIVYRNIESAIPIDSEYTKWSLLDLHENICIQRSPNQFRQNQFFWAHHEKLVVVDNMMAFVGGVDLCFGRWDDPCHSLTDDKLTGFELNHEGPRDSEHCQVWPGKDYSNPRVQDFYALDRPYEEMYDRTKVPRMPWHDIAMQLVGQPARDVGRHFVQRWNYILRSRIPSRPTPILIPPPEYEQLELDNLGMTGSCQVQILRSCSSWSIGTPGKTEHSIMNAYCHLIQTSQHFVYIENQFFITSCVVEGATIHNKIGDALVERIIRAHEEGEDWGACIIIPLMPGFQNSVDSQDGTSIRLIMQCQFRSICRGETSIFGRLREMGIHPEDYIRFYALRQWGKIGPRKCLTTEQLYIHAKCMVVDDRSVIIGSANINERSMLGSRDSEVAAIVTDMRMIPSFMGGEAFEVGEFAHTLRKRLMREHLGIDVDAVYRREQATREREEQDAEMARIYRAEFTKSQEAVDYFSAAASSPPQAPTKPLAASHKMDHKVDASSSSGGNASNGLDGTTRGGSTTSLGVQPAADRRETAIQKKEHEHDLDVDGFGFDNMRALVDAGDVALTDTFVDAHGREVLLKKDAPDAERVRSMEEQENTKQVLQEEQKKLEEMPSILPPYLTERTDTHALGLAPRHQLPELPVIDDTDIGGPALTRGDSSLPSRGKFVNPLFHTLRRPEVNEDCMTDPLVSTFYYDIWHAVAENNTKIYRAVFRCMPDSEVTDWRTYEQFNTYNERFMQSQGLGQSTPKSPKDAPDKSGPPGSGGTEAASTLSEAAGKIADSIASPDASGRARSKSVFSGLVDKLRPGSKAEEPTHVEQMHEDEKANEVRTARSSPTSGASDVPTAVPSPLPAPMDGNEAQKQADQAEQSEAQRPTSDQIDEKQAVKEEDFAGAEGRKTVQYSENTSSKDVNNASETTATQSNTNTSGSLKRRRRGTTKSSGRPHVEEVMGREEAEALLNLIQGHLVLWPYDWLEKEERGGNWLYNIDQLAPLEIYD